MDCLPPQLNSPVKLTFLMWEDVSLPSLSRTHTKDQLLIYATVSSTAVESA